MSTKHTQYATAAYHQKKLIESRVNVWEALLDQYKTLSQTLDGLPNRTRHSVMVLRANASQLNRFCSVDRSQWLLTISIIV